LESELPKDNEDFVLESELPKDNEDFESEVPNDGSDDFLLESDSFEEVESEGFVTPNWNPAEVLEDLESELPKDNEDFVLESELPKDNEDFESEVPNDGSDDFSLEPSSSFFSSLTPKVIPLDDSLLSFSVLDFSVEVPKLSPKELVVLESSSGVFVSSWTEDEFELLP